MNQTRLQEALGEIDERFIAEAHEPQAIQKPSAHIIRRGLLAAAALIIMALSLFAYGSGRWFSIADPQRMAADSWYRIQNKTIYNTDPAGRIELDDPNGGNIFGFRINDPTIPEEEVTYRWDLKTYLEQKCLISEATMPEAELEDTLYWWAWTRSDGEKLTVHMQERTELGIQDYVSYYEFDLVREGMINGMEAVWICAEHPYVEHTYHLICHSPVLGCFVTVSSDRGFENAEALAEKLVFVDSGAFVPRKSERTVYALSYPEDLDIVFSVAMDRVYTGAVLKDRTLDPAELPLQIGISCPTHVGTLQMNIHASIVDQLYGLKYELSESPPVEQLTVNGCPAYLFQLEKRQYRLIIAYEDIDCFVEIINEKSYSPFIEQETILEELKSIGAKLKPIPVAIEEDEPIDLISTLAGG